MEIIAGPWVLRWRLDQLCPDRIPVNVPHAVRKVFLRLHQPCFKPAAEQSACSIVFPVNVKNVVPCQVFHEKADTVLLDRFDQQVQVISH